LRKVFGVAKIYLLSPPSNLLRGGTWRKNNVRQLQARPDRYKRTKVDGVPVMEVGRQHKRGKTARLFA
jgi:hypothetical protein